MTETTPNNLPLKKTHPIFTGLLSFWSEHPEQTSKNGRPAHESHYHGPAASPTIVNTDDRKPGNK